MTSWVKYARPFARRRRMYRRKRARFDCLDVEQSTQWERYDCAVEAIGWMWADFRNEILSKKIPDDINIGLEAIASIVDGMITRSDAQLPTEEIGPDNHVWRVDFSRGQLEQWRKTLRAAKLI